MKPVDVMSSTYFENKEIKKVINKILNLKLVTM